MASKSSIEAGRGHVSLSVDSTALERGLQMAQVKMQSFGKGIAIAGVGIAAAGSAIVAPFMAGLAVFTSWGSEMREAMRDTGISFQELDDLMDGLNVGAEELVPAVAKMSAVLTDAASGSVSANNSLRELGLTIGELSSLSQGERVQRIAEALGNVADESKRISLQRDIFGRGGLALNVSGGAAGMQERRERRDYLEGTPSSGDMALAASTGKLFKEMNLAIAAIWREIGAAAAPVMKQFYTFVIDIVVRVRKWVEENRALLTTIFYLADKLILVGSVIAGVGTAIYVAAYAFTFISGAMQIVRLNTILTTAVMWTYRASLFALSVAYNVAAAAGFLFGTGVLAPLVGIGLITAAIYGLSLLLPSLSSAGTTAARSIALAFAPLREMFVGMGQTFVTVWGGIVDAIAAGDTQAALGIVAAGFDVLWQQISIGARTQFGNITSWLAGLWIDLGTSLAAIIFQSIGGLRLAWAGLITFMTTVMNTALVQMEKMWIRAREAVNPLGSTERTNRLLAEADQAGRDRQVLIDQGGLNDRERITADTNRELANLERDRQALQLALQAGGPENDPALIAARERLNISQQELQLARDTARFWREYEETMREFNAPQGPGGEGLGVDGKITSIGSFNAQAAFGFLGTSTRGETLAERTAREQRERLHADNLAAQALVQNIIDLWNNETPAEREAREQRDRQNQLIQNLINVAGQVFG